MTHQQYEDWLFISLDPEAEPLALDEKQALAAHLETCQTCQQLAWAWSAMENELKEAPMVEPQAGFSMRWLDRQSASEKQAERERLYRRQSLAMLAFTIAAGMLTIASLVIISLPLVDSPNLLFWSLVYRAMEAVSTIMGVGGMVSSLFDTAAGVAPVGLWILVFGLVCELGVLWVVSFRLLTKPRRVTS
jgi:hypothetical protein